MALKSRFDKPKSHCCLHFSFSCKNVANEKIDVATIWQLRTK